MLTCDALVDAANVQPFCSGGRCCTCPRRQGWSFWWLWSVSVDAMLLGSLLIPWVLDPWLEASELVLLVKKSLCWNVGEAAMVGLAACCNAA